MSEVQGAAILLHHSYDIASYTQYTQGEKEREHENICNVIAIVIGGYSAHGFFFRASCSTPGCHQAGRRPDRFKAKISQARAAPKLVEEESRKDSKRER
jgi:hypothetical protein